MSAQQTLDENGFYQFPHGTDGTVVLSGREYAVHQPALPLFAKDGDRITGQDGLELIDGWLAGSIVVHSWPRGLISDAHYSINLGYRTMADSHLWITGSAWSLGPTGGWSTVRKLRIVGDYTLNDGTDWHGIGLCGIQGPYGWDAPEPWEMYCDSGRMYLVYRTTTEVRRLSVAIPSLTTNLVFDWTIDLDAGTTSCSLGAVTGTVDAGSVLSGDMYHGFSIGRLTPFAASEGYWYDAWRDLWIGMLNVYYNNTLTCSLAPKEPRPTTYVNGPSLPLVETGSAGKWAFAVKRGQALQSGGIVTKNLKLKGRPGCPIMTIGSMIGGGLRVEDCEFTGGSQGLNFSTVGVAYPVVILNSSFVSQGDVACHYYRAHGSLIDNCDFAYAPYASLRLMGCGLKVSNCREYPPGTPAVAFAVQSGGDCIYTNIKGDYEFAHENYRMFRIQPASWDFDWFATSAKINGCSFRAVSTIHSDPDLMVMDPMQDAYVGPFMVAMDGSPVILDTRSAESRPMQTKGVLLPRHLRTARFSPENRGR